MIFDFILPASMRLKHEGKVHPELMAGKVFEEVLSDRRQWT